MDRGAVNGVSLDGLAIVAALSGDRNLGMTEMGGAKPTVRSAMYVDERANAAQRLALVAMANELSSGLVGTVVQVTSAPIQFMDHGGEIEVSAGQVALDVSKHLVHDPTCGAMQWFHPFSSLNDAAIGMTATHTFTGSSLGTKWSDPNKRSAFFGSFCDAGQKGRTCPPAFPAIPALSAPSMLLSDKVALITGGKRIGQVVARELAARGVDVALTYARSKAEADQAADIVRGAGRRAAVFQADLSQPPECGAVVTEDDC